MKTNLKSALPGAVVLLSCLLTLGCGEPSPAPALLAHTPLEGATNIGPNTSVTATFTLVMEPLSLTPSTFTLTSGTPPTAVPGRVLTSGPTAVFWPAALLAPDTTYTATVTTGATTSAGIALPLKRAWTFTTGNTLTPGLPVTLGVAGSFTILAMSGVSTVPPSIITGDVAVSPAAATALTGFSLTADATNTFSNSPQVAGKLFAADDAPPTPATLTAAVGDMQRAFTDAAGRAPTVTELGAGNIGGRTLAPGVYRWGSGLQLATDVTLHGLSTDVWVFQVAQGLTLASAVRVTLTGGALPQNVFWQVAGAVDLGTTSHLEGVVLTQTSVSLRTGASVTGRLLAQTAVTLDTGTVLAPAR